MGLVTDEFATKTATKPTKNDSVKKATIGKMRARAQRNIDEGKFSFSVLSETSWESIKNDEIQGSASYLVRIKSFSVNVPATGTIYPVIGARGVQ